MSSVAGSSLPPYDDPPRFRIGSQETQTAFVSIPQVKGHLALLDALRKLRLAVEQGDAFGAPEWTNKMPDKERRWARFVGVAVERCVFGRVGG